MVAGLLLIEVCSGNPACTQALFDLESEHAHVSVLENDCMSFCDLCATTPYVLIEGEICAAVTPEAVIDKVRYMIQQHDADAPIH